MNDPPHIAGLKVLPQILAMMVLSPIAGRLSDRFGSRWLSTLGLGVTLVAQVWMSTLLVDVPYVTLGAALAVLGVGNGLFMSPNNNAVMGSVSANRRGVAAGTRNLLMNSGQTMAIATAMVILSTVMSYQILAVLFTGSQSFDNSAFMDGFHEVFLFGAFISGIAMVCSS